jgi:metal-dependent amidase/aminoacylase/carboxypeptidase family protein
MKLSRVLTIVILLTAFSLSSSDIFFRASAKQPKPLGPDRAAQWSKDRLNEVDNKLEGEAKNLVALYQQFHANPELSLMEVKTAARLMDEMRKTGFEVTEHVGGTGLVCVLKNGPGPVVLLRTDIDALPIAEQTGVPYASKVRAKDRFGVEVGVMHACGHDVHMASWVGTARVLSALKYKRFPKPDFALALHSDPLQPTGVVSYTEGLALANADTVDLLVKGKGGHGAAPHATIDPIVLSARIILDLQTIVSRETNPLDPVVVTVGSIHGGTKHNIIPNEVKLQLTVRTTKTETRDRVLKAIGRIAKAAAAGALAPEPVMTVNLDEFTPATLNDVPLSRRMGEAFKQVVGAANVKSRPTMMGAEDFGRYGQGGIPTFIYFLGTIPKEKYEAAQKPDGPKLPGMHTDGYAPVPEPSIRTGVRTECLAILNLLGK